MTYVTVYSRQEEIFRNSLIFFKSLFSRELSSLVRLFLQIP